MKVKDITLEQADNFCKHFMGSCNTCPLNFENSYGCVYIFLEQIHHYENHKNDEIKL